MGGVGKAAELRQMGRDDLIHRVFRRSLGGIDEGEEDVLVVRDLRPQGIPQHGLLEPGPACRVLLQPDPVVQRHEGGVEAMVTTTAGVGIFPARGDVEPGVEMLLVVGAQGGMAGLVARDPRRDLHGYLKGRGQLDGLGGYRDIGQSAQTRNLAQGLAGIGPEHQHSRALGRQGVGADVEDG